jgi:hypothetical protein
LVAVLVPIAICPILPKTLKLSEEEKAPGVKTESGTRKLEEESSSAKTPPKDKRVKKAKTKK